ncbi:Oxidoreductase probably involved in sulfite reduction [hydrothermal vent metagenome]|uniref:Oxidoreductase probably involved in sulfite reduction n=1 Tax=hydrothermal vent metagenome TaxID=652676 RepID=A0A3B0SMD0_9ZZZZ
MVEVIRFRDDEAHEEPAVSLDAFLDQSNATAVRVEAGEDVRLLLPLLDRISLVEIDFPVFGDGRGYSAAQILREAGYTGELRASGDVLVDQVAYLRRCGFDALVPDCPIDPQVMDKAMRRYAHVYQGTSDGRSPIWRLRHE